MKRITKEERALAFCIAFFPPLWAVVAPHLGVSTGAVALICAGLYVANGNEVKDGVSMSIGFLMGDLWAVLALKIMEYLPWNADITLYITLFVLGAMAVILAAFLPKLIYCPAMLCGWAIGLTIMAPIGIANIGSLPFQIGTAMLIGVWYVGFGVDWVQKKILRK
ncbi:hypothetical protein lbkm_0104 [Lachnospiraceae bacterium KM106-2]|nr:hypothetical protein lbkm_0104 [Lachnospiraceae bacterium KM106-2]